MYPDPKSFRTSVGDRLDSRFGRSPPSSFSDRRAALRRHPQEANTRNYALYGEENYDKQKGAIPTDRTPRKLEKDASRSPRRTIVREIRDQNIAAVNARTPKVASVIVSAGRSPTLVASAKEPSAATSTGKKYILVTLDVLLEKLGLSKYLVTFKAEEVDMYALKHMNDDDLRSLGLPMGPRKKILHALSRLKAKK